MRRVSVEQIINDEKTVAFGAGDGSYLLSYPEFIAHFRNLDVVTPHHLIIGAHFVYGWMRTSLEMRTASPDEDLPLAAKMLDKAKQGDLLSHSELDFLKGLINNSLVGTSKLLHFINPNIYAIWDSWVYKYINGKKPWWYQIGDISNYLAYLDNCREIVADPRFTPAHRSINRKVGYEVTPLRAVELIMFVTAHKLA